MQALALVYSTDKGDVRIVVDSGIDAGNCGKAGSKGNLPRRNSKQAIQN